MENDSYKIFKSVGLGGANIPTDVKVIQKLLNQVVEGNFLKPLDLLVVDGKVGKHTRHAISEFQRRLVGFPIPDGRVDPSGQTIKKLIAFISELKSKTIRDLQASSFSKTYKKIELDKMEAVPKVKLVVLDAPSYPPGVGLELRGLNREEFVKRVYEEAKKEQAVSKVPAGVTTAQAILETGYGKHVPSDVKTGVYSFNLFGIKGNGPAGSVEVYTHEYIGGVKTRVVDKFKAYHNFSESISGRTHFFQTNRRYRVLFSSEDAIKWADGLQACGYATDPKYADKLKSLIKQWKLEE